MSLTTILAFVVVLGVLIFFHELGHFLLAKFFNVGVEKFSLGFGPRIFGKTVGRTDYRVSAIPLGGYVKMVGEEPDAEISPEDLPYSFTHKPVFQRILIVAAGPAFNMLLAAIIFSMIFLVSGIHVLKPVVGSVSEDMPAGLAGLQKGDEIVDIEGQPVDTWEDMSRIITASNGNSLEIMVLREGKTFTTRISPRLQATKNIFGEEEKRYIIGITAGNATFQRDAGIFKAIGGGIVRTWDVTKLTILSIVKLIQGIVPTDTVGGPIMIAQLAGQQAREGAMNLAFLIALLSVNLAILNILPIPVLDGGHLLFFSIEAITGKPVNTRVREVAQQAGLFILMLLMVFVFYNDIARIFAS